MNYADESFKSLFIKMYFNETELSSGTGFLVESSSGPVLITNRHNLTGRHNETGKCMSETLAVPNRIEIYHHKKGELGTVMIKSESLYSNETPLWFEHPYLGDTVDFVALKLTEFEDIETFTYSLTAGDHMRIGVSDIISVVGFPFGIQVGKNAAIWATGFIASEPEIDYRDLPLFLIDCRSRKGQSGSAVVAYRPGGQVLEVDGSIGFYASPTTKLIGIYSGRYNKDSDLGYVWKVSSIKELIDSI
ncbi:serine protease [Rhodococcus qingshengii]|nr:serine protease [Rhodococcus qingshengii]